jgi:hypothetical protein
MMTYAQALSIIQDSCTSAAANARKPDAQPWDIINAIQQQLALVAAELPLDGAKVTKLSRLHSAPPLAGCAENAA